MIFSGWILPDLYEIKCLSCTGSKEHIKVVEKYLMALKKRDNYLFNEIAYCLYKNSPISLDDFVVQALNWVKVLDNPERYIYYASSLDNYLLLKKYEKIGYSIIPLSQIKTTFDINIKSSELLI